MTHAEQYALLCNRYPALKVLFACIEAGAQFRGTPPQFAVLVDASGSMRDYRDQRGEQALLRQLYNVWADAVVELTYLSVPSRTGYRLTGLKDWNPAVCGSDGGTDLKAGVRFIEAGHKHGPYDAAFFLTDGGDTVASVPPSPPIVWVRPEGCTESLEHLPGAAHIQLVP